jgi:hypothetical protein
MLVFGDFSSVVSLGRCLAASPELRPRVPARYWRRIYQTLGIEEPRERISSIFGELLDPEKQRLRTAEQNERLTNMYPYYHSAAVYAPKDCSLRELWEEDIGRIAASYTPDDNHWRDLGTSDQAGLSVALVLLQRQGVSFQRLPDEYDVNWPHLLSGVVPWENVKLFHASGAFSVPPDANLDRRTVTDCIDGYCDYLLRDRLQGRHRFDAVLRKDPKTFRHAIHQLRRALHAMHSSIVSEYLD